MRELGGLIAAVMLLALAGPAMAVPVARPTSVATVLPDQVAVEKARADKAERDLAIQTAAREIEAAQTDRAYSRFEILIGLVGGLFGILVTVIVIYFSLKTDRAAVGAAILTAREELRQARDAIQALREQAEAATETARTAAETASAALANAETAAIATASERDRAQRTNEQMETLQRRAAAVVDELTSRSSGSAKSDLTEEQSETLREAAQQSAGSPESDWSVDQFKAAIGKAQYVDKDWPEALRLASVMARTHRENKDAQVQSLILRGDAECDACRFTDSLESYDKAIAFAALTDTPTQQTDTLSAKHSRCTVLIDLNRPAEAEKAALALILEQEKLLASDSLYKLSTRHVLARAILDQGRFDEASKSYETLTPTVESAFGPDSLQTYVARYNWAWAMVEAGDATAAEAIIAPIHATAGIDGWSARHSARLAFVRARIADAQGHCDQADQLLTEAEGLYLARFAANHHERRKFDAYMAARTPPDTSDA
ncbi:MAG: tetratricopeptide repeat protein [Pseudomonadota bacterium]